MSLRLRNRLNRILHERGLAEGDVALVTRIDQGHLNRIKNGRVQPNLVTAMRIADALGVTVNQVFYLEHAVTRPSREETLHEGRPSVPGHGAAVGPATAAP